MERRNQVKEGGGKEGGGGGRPGNTPKPPPPPPMAAVFSFSWASAFGLGFLLLLLAAISVACLSLPVESILKKFLLWIKQDLGFWGPLVLAFAYIPLSVLAVPASILTLGGGYLFGLPVGFVVDSTGATLGATAAFLLGRTIGRSYVLSKLNDYPKFQAVAIAIQRSGFKPSTFGLVYVGTTVKDLSNVTHGWEEISTTHWVYMALGMVTSVVLIVCIARVAKASLDKALVENTDNSILATTPAMLPTVAETPSDLHKPLILKIGSIREDQEKQLPF